MLEPTENKALPRGTTDTLTGAPWPRLMDMKASGAYMAVSYWTVRSLIDSGVLATVKLPCPRSSDGRVLRRILIDRKDLDALIEANKELEL